MVFVLQIAVPGFTEFLYFDTEAMNPWMFVTSVFLHGGLMHLLFNSFALLMFGPRLERKVGGRSFLMMFLLAGIAGNILYFATIVFGIIPAVPALGASGAIYGILGALSVLFPKMVIYFWYVPLNIRVATVLWILIETMGAFNPGSGIANAAHLGGLVFGILFGYYYKRKIEEKIPGVRFLN